MTVTTSILGYLQDPYLNNPYGTSQAQASAGLQFFAVIDAIKAHGVQKQFQILDYIESLGLQAQFIIKADNAQGLQGNLVINSQEALGVEQKFIINYLNEIGIQAQFSISGVTDTQGVQTVFNIESKGYAAIQFLADLNQSEAYGVQFQGVIAKNMNKGLEFRSDKYPSGECVGMGYLMDEYLSGPYAVATWCMKPGLQAKFMLVDKLDANGLQTKFIINALSQYGVQSKFQIVDKKAAFGVQFNAQTVLSTALQFLATIYNTNNLRILCEFPSRGSTASNWAASSTEPGDFSIQNVDTDIVEQIWRSATGVKTGINLTTDTGLPQGVFVDTVAILNHNMTRSATINLLGSNDPTFSIVGTTIPLQARVGDIYYVAPSLPLSGYRYWRLTIDDNSNAENFVSIGTIIFGSSRIFQGECFVDEIDFELKDYADTVRTEGFTNVSNSRALKKKVRLEFRSLDASLNNFKTMRSIFQTYRTTHKCLWIPTPDPVDQEVTARFAVYGKLSIIPSERHNSKGANANYVTFSVEIDESL
jgi:hypothetical protein